MKFYEYNKFGHQVKEAPFIHITRPTRKPQKILLCGWRRDIDDMIVVSSINQKP